MEKHLRSSYDHRTRSTLVQCVEAGAVIASAHIVEGDMAHETTATITRQRPERVSREVLEALAGWARASGASVVPAAA